MPKRPFKITARLPPYCPPRTTWRRAIHQAVTERLERSHVKYLETDRLALTVRLYFNSDLLDIVDVDNRLKEVMDALQGHVGGHGKKRWSLKAIIPNDNRIFRVTVEKRLAPKQSADGRGHLTITKNVRNNNEGADAAPSRAIQR